MARIGGVLFLCLALTAAGVPAGAAPLVVVAPASPLSDRSVVRVASNNNQIKALAQQAMALTDEGRLQEADQALDQAIELNKAHGRAGGEMDQLLRTMKARVLMQAGQFDTAETVLKQLIVEAEASAGRKRDPSSIPFSSLGELYMRQARWAEAEPLLRRAAQIIERDAGKNDPATAEALNTLAVFYLRTGQVGQATPILERILKIFRRKNTPANRASAADVMVNLGGAYQMAGEYDKALDYFRQAYETDVDLLGPEHPNSILALNNGGVLLGVMGRFDEAVPMLATVLEATKARYGDENPLTAHALNNVGWAELSRKNYPAAMGYLRPALAIYLRHRELQKVGPNARGAAVDEREVGRTILGFLTAANALALADPAASSGLIDEAFIAAQQVHRGKAAEALALTTARFAVGGGPLAGLIREQQDLSEQHQSLERQLTAAFSMPAKQRDLQQEAAGREQLATMAARIEAIHAEIDKGFPAYASLADPKPLSIAEAQFDLGPGEALVLVAPFGGSNGEGSFTFVVTRQEAKWRAAGIGQTRMTEMVQGLRCGLDIGQWGTKAGRESCMQLTGAEPAGEALPFDAGLAHDLFAELFGGLEPLLADKTLLVAAPDPLASLPFQVLLTAAPTTPRPQGKAFAEQPFLGRTNAIAVLPSAASLRGARASGGEGAPQPYIGFGDPALVGGLDCAEMPVAQSCPTIGSPAGAGLRLASTGEARIDRVLRGGSRGLADVEAIRAMCPLPETALELRCVDESVDGAPDAVHIGDRATVPEVLSAPLDQYRIVHFATHGLLAGDMASEDGTVSEPALVLTPPAVPTAENDGLLRASEIATLRLNADWVVLSACNTAAGSSLGGEAMSGLASAFLYAGARALLVSHWPVRSDAAVLLTTAAFAEMKRDPAIGRAVAMRDAMMALLDEPSGAYAHPSVWAPFAVVGESGPARL